MNEDAKTGLVGFFDILGYQNLLERNDPETIAQEVLPILTGIGKKVPEQIKLMWDRESEVSQEQKNQALAIIDAMGWLVFSDTVLLTLAVDPSDPRIAGLYWVSFLSAAVILQKELFKAGLPVRGAIDYGKFFVKDTCFAGRTIVNAYQLCCQLELAACVLSPAAAAELRDNQTCQELFGTFIVEYMVPIKEREQHMLVVMAHSYDLNRPDIHTTVMGAFWGNRKDISRSARAKASNTEQWLEFLERQEKTIKNSTSR